MGIEHDCITKQRRRATPKPNPLQDHIQPQFPDRNDDELSIRRRSGSGSSGLAQPRPAIIEDTPTQRKASVILGLYSMNSPFKTDREGVCVQIGLDLSSIRVTSHDNDQERGGTNVLAWSRCLFLVEERRGIRCHLPPPPQIPKER